jgi:hypothetical protein
VSGRAAAGLGRDHLAAWDRLIAWTRAQPARPRWGGAPDLFDRGWTVALLEGMEATQGDGLAGLLSTLHAGAGPAAEPIRAAAGAGIATIEPGAGQAGDTRRFATGAIPMAAGFLGTRGRRRGSGTPCTWRRGGCRSGAAGGRKPGG